MDKVKAYLAGMKPDFVDMLLVVLIVLYYLQMLPAELNNEVLNLKNAALALFFKNIFPQRIDDITKRLQDKYSRK